MSSPSKGVITTRFLVWISLSVVLCLVGIALAAVGLSSGASNAPMMMIISGVGLALAVAMIIFAAVQKKRRG
jgi:protein-S-isoprenylcysteine O-methyltransferase Ste14